ncbi:hypothetical protein EJ04DRAFT_583632 [Polyplosphaeria fusca]|uniref:Uncharacterized protein n=1 Tax=Polyplosphaeria fusca TaxID=682080 RepID=A0A9P4UWV3_9PLEO|nr:hypothetical protein EJ04DRAFT_583632 [Polyplosphaeria fusca]
MAEGTYQAFVPDPPIHRLSIDHAFPGLSKNEKFYAHYMARAAWHGTRIILRQVSPESLGIFDFILDLHSSCSGDWNALVQQGCFLEKECAAFLKYAATFLSNVGNYYGRGD